MPVRLTPGDSSVVVESDDPLHVVLFHSRLAEVRTMTGVSSNGEPSS